MLPDLENHQFPDGDEEEYTISRTVLWLTYCPCKQNSINSADRLPACTMVAKPPSLISELSPSWRIS
jgi:hypothetical protein